jgi:DNA-damage-inducible protein J
MYLRGLMASTSTMVHVRVNQKVKAKAARNLAAMGMSVSDAVRIMLLRVAVENSLPFEIRIPNKTTTKALRAADQSKGKRFKTSDQLFEDLEI